MSDYDDEHSKRPRPAGEGVRIIGAEEAAAAIETGQVAGRRPEDEPRFGDVPPRPKGPAAGVRFPLPDSVDPSTAVSRPPIINPAGAGESPELPHWTEPATGEVPRIISGDREEGEDLDSWPGFGTRTSAPRWRDKGTDWEEADFDDVASLGGDDIRMGALDVNRTEHSDLFEFDEPEPSPVAYDPSADVAPLLDADPPTGGTTRIRTRSERPSPASPPRGARRPARPNGGPASPRGGGAAGTSGRDMGTAVGVGLAMAVVAIICFKAGNATTLVLALAVVTMAAAEGYAAVRKAGHAPATLLGLCATVSLLLATYHEGVAAYPLVMAITVVFAFLWYLAEVVRARPTVNIAVTLLVFFWIGGLGGFAALMLTAPDRRGVAFLLGAVLCTVAYDVGGLFFGSQIGRRPLMPEISPNKTVEGLVGGMGAAILMGVLVGFFLHPWASSLPRGLALGVVVAVAAPLGDLCESMIKRDIGVKDMGAILPGHGGVLDRFDALLFVLPAVYYLAQLLKLA